MIVYQADPPPWVTTLLSSRVVERGVVMGFKYQGFDFIGVDGSLTEEELLVRREVRAFVEERVTPKIEEWWREGKLERGLAREMGAMGCWGRLHDSP